MNRAARGQIASFSLYGERSGAPSCGLLHVEDIQSRSRKYLWKIGSHRHLALCQCIFVTSGPVTVEIEGETTISRGPTAFVIPSGTVHGFRFGATSRGYVLTLSIDRLLMLMGAAHQLSIAELFAAPRVLDLGLRPVHSRRAQQLLDALLNEFVQSDAAAPVLGWLACSVLWILASVRTANTVVVPADRRDLDRLRRFRRLIEAHYLEHWPVSRYAGQLAVSQSSLNRLCRSLAGGSAFDEIRQRLHLEARRRLLYVAAPIVFVGAQLGFKDPAYFCRFFRKYAGMSPSAFRRCHGNDESRIMTD